MQIYGAHVQVLVFRLFSASVDLTCDAPHNQRNGNEKSSRIAGETARGTPMFRFSKPETPRAALFVFLRNETRAKSGFVSFVSISLCFDFDPTRRVRRLPRLGTSLLSGPAIKSGTCSRRLLAVSAGSYVRPDFFFGQFQCVKSQADFFFCPLEGTLWNVATRTGTVLGMLRTQP